MNPLVGPILNQRTLFAVKQYWVRPLSKILTELLKTETNRFNVTHHFQGGWPTDENSE